MTLAFVLPIGPASAQTALRAPYNPTANISANPQILSSGQCIGRSPRATCANPCVSATLTLPLGTSTSACDAYVLRAISNARTRENVRPMTLPTNWTRLTVQQQQFVLLNLERVNRGYPPYLGLNAALSANAQSAAAATRDPSIAAGFAVGNDAVGYPGMGGSWSSGYSPLLADYYLMYSDGWGGSPGTTANIACISSSAPGCWAHRDQLLGADPGFNPGVGLGCTTCEVGTGFAVVRGAPSYANLIELPAATPPAMTFTWASEVPFLRAAAATSTTSTSTSTSTTSTSTTTTPSGAASTSSTTTTNGDSNS